MKKKTKSWKNEVNRAKCFNGRKKESKGLLQVLWRSGNLSL
jgi:hypothetical protein